MTGGLALHVLGFVAEQSRVSILGLLLYSWGVVTLGGGSRWGRAAMFPFALPGIAIPMNVLDSAGFWLRMWVVDASHAVSHGLGIAVIKSGTQLLAPDGSYDYDVAAACSGVRSLTALAAIALLIGYLRFRPWFVRAASPCRQRTIHIDRKRRASRSDCRGRTPRWGNMGGSGA